MSEHENEPGGPHYGGERGGESAGSSGGQGGKGEAAGESGEKPADAQSGQSGGRGPTERDGEPTAEGENSDASPTKSSADRAEEKQHEMEKSGEESPG